MGELSLQSGFIIAVLFAVVFVLRRLGGDEEFLRRGAQIVIAVVIALTVISATSAFIRHPEAPEGISSFGSDDEEEREVLEEFVRDLSRRDSEAETIHLGAAIILASIGAFALKKFVFLPLSLVLSGILLLLAGGSGDPQFVDTFSAIYSSYLPGRGDPGQEWDIARFLVLLLGTTLLVLFALLRWESIRSVAGEDQAGPKDDTEAQSP